MLSNRTLTRNYSQLELFVSNNHKLLPTDLYANIQLSRYLDRHIVHCCS